MKALSHVRSDHECQEELTHVNSNVNPAGYLLHAWKYQKYLSAVLTTQQKNTELRQKKKKSTLNTSRSLPIWAGEIRELPEQSDRPEGPRGIWSPTRTQCVCITPSAASGSRISDLVILLFLGACANRQIWTNSRDSLALRCAGGL